MPKEQPHARSISEVSHPLRHTEALLSLEDHRLCHKLPGLLSEASAAPRVRAAGSGAVRRA